MIISIITRNIPIHIQNGDEMFFIIIIIII